MHITRLHQVAVAAQDLNEATAFYRDTLGARFVARFDPPGLVFFDLSGTRILLERGARQATLYFRVDDIDTAHAALIAKGVVFDSAPHIIHRDDAGDFGAKGAEEWMAFFKDPSGNILALATQRMPR